MEMIYRFGTNEILYSSPGEKQLGPPSEWNQWRSESTPFWNVRLREHFFDGMMISSLNIEVFEHIVLSTSQQAPLPGMGFVKQGHLVTTAHSGGGPRKFAPRQHNIFINPYTSLRTELPAQPNLEVLLLGFQRERFLQLAEHAGPVMNQLAENITANKPAPYLQSPNLPLTPRMTAIIQEIEEGSYQGGLMNLFLQSKLLELLALQCGQLEMANRGTAGRETLSMADMNKVREAREILLHDLHRPPTLGMLAKQTGLNEFKLKNGFKKMFGASVFGYLKSHRLEMARDMIRGGGKSVTEVAYETGYSTLQHFSNEFRKKFGVSPGRLK
ncbi:helix-turn-helix transcriptional regulator [Chitinophaga sp. GCM10012297]|uniref:Helix-turn-helix transcriptional regulator n=1 Tax=Chitinophaga chungangae TaxID=2821488 RepID=A0ABS3YIT4_9BACT|nr:AraC family transcriptional regulator [Chitinophaga chungangae]MBO9153999.1 helix-turn-helix transcriptional regulator [Chitinophaga chungangae]